MAPLAPENMHRLVETIKQSPPPDLSSPCDPSGVAAKTILITGGASGFGAAFARHWAEHGAHIVIGDIDDAAGNEVADEMRRSSGSEHHHYRHCDVTVWQDQVDLFKAAARLSPTGRIDAVVANAGVANEESAATGKGFENPKDLDADEPPPPNLGVMDVNITGVMYTTHLALFWLQREGGNDATDTAGGGTLAPERHGAADARGRGRDRHILLVGSIAGLAPLAGLPQYTASKHAVTGLFRALRGTAWRQGVRANLVCPYFADTAILPGAARLCLAGGAMGGVADVVDAATRLVADGAVAGRALVVGPRMVDQGEDAGDDIDDEEDDEEGEEEEEEEDENENGGAANAVWEVYAHDYDSVDVFVRRYIRMLNAVVLARGWIGWAKDVLGLLWSRFRR